MMNIYRTKDKEDNVETREMTTEEKQRKLFIDILCHAAESETKRSGNVRYKEISLFLPLKTIEDIESWVLNK